MSSSSSFVEPSCFPSPSPLPPPSEDPLPSQLLSVKSKYHDDIRRFKVEKRIQAIRQHVAAAYGLQHFSIFFSEPLTFDLVTIDSDKELNLALEILSIDTPKDVLTVIIKDNPKERISFTEESVTEVSDLISKIISSGKFDELVQAAAPPIIRALQTQKFLPSFTPRKAPLVGSLPPSNNIDDFVFTSSNPISYLPTPITASALASSNTPCTDPIDSDIKLPLSIVEPAVVEAALASQDHPPNSHQHHHHHQHHQPATAGKNQSREPASKKPMVDAFIEDL